MLTTITTLTLAAALAAPMQDGSDRTSAHSLTQEKQQKEKENETRAAAQAARYAAIMESKLGLTIYRPESVSAVTLVRYANEVTSGNVTFARIEPVSGTLDLDRRDRFLVMENLIGVQDFEDGRKAAIDVLKQLDAMLASPESGEPTSPKSSLEVRSIRLRTLDLDTASALVEGVAPAIRQTKIKETGTLVLQGLPAEVELAAGTLAEIDQPLPQITLHVSLIQATVSGNPTDQPKANPEVAAALSKVLPGKQFHEVGTLMLRGSSGGGAFLEVSSSLLGMSEHEEKMNARVTWSASARGLDPKTKTLSLDGCRLLLEIPTFTTTTNGVTNQVNFAGYRKEGLTTDLAVRADQTTVLGSLGGEPIYVSVRFAIDE